MAAENTYSGRHEGHHEQTRLQRDDCRHAQARLELSQDCAGLEDFSRAGAADQPEGFVAEAQAQDDPAVRCGGRHADKAAHALRGYVSRRDRSMKPELPERMCKLPLDHRGYPVPVTIQRDTRGKPLFVANDSEVVAKCIKRKLCSICGERLTRELWFTGGPNNALHPHGGYLDPAMHHE